MEASNSIVEVMLYTNQLAELIVSSYISHFSGKDDNFISLPIVYTATVLWNGTVYAESKEIDFSTWCLNSNHNWPYEQLECDILLQLSQNENISLIPMNGMEEVFKVYYVGH